MEIGQIIKDARKKAGLTQKELAEKAGTAAGTIQQYERGIRQPRIKQIEQIAKALEVDPCSLMDWDTASEYLVSDINGKIRMKRIEKAFHQLNDEGQAKAVERVEELAEVPRLRNADDLTQPPDIGPLSEEEEDALFPRDPEFEEALRAEELHALSEKE